MLLYCSSAQGRYEADCPDSKANPATYRIDDRGRFCDGDTYIIETSSAPGKRSGIIEEKKNSARRAAVLYAQYKIFEYFKGYRIETRNPIDELSKGYGEGCELREKEMGRIVKTGSLLSERLDSDQNCTILYIVNRKKLLKVIRIPFEDYKVPSE